MRQRIIKYVSLPRTMEAAKTITNAQCTLAFFTRGNVKCSHSNGVLTAQFVSA